MSMQIYLWALVVALGLAIGSFVNVLIYRLPKHESIFWPRSRCPSCKHVIRWHHNIPVLSWLILRGRCAFCGKRIGAIYPGVELICALLFAAFYARYGVSFTTLGFWYMAATLLAVFFIDLEHQIIPNKLTYPGVVVGVATAFVSAHLTVLQSLLGVLAGVALFAGIAFLGRLLFKEESMGGGDVKLAAMLGAFLGAGKMMIVLVLSAAIGLVISLAVMLVSPRLRQERLVPFGPFLAIATLVVAFFGESIVGYYVRHFLR
ncbi:MAG: prepilin peptidase [candidate division Zixibacteria bacterium]|nr:prepilin peptidase [candidate division Zixibacteria bacterium]